MFTLYSMPSSGNSYKVRLLLSLLNQSYTHVGLEYETSALDQASSGSPPARWERARTSYAAVATRSRSARLPTAPTAA